MHETSFLAINEAAWTAVLAAFTFFLAIVGWWQIQSLRRENKLERTLAACIRYESDATIETAVRKLRLYCKANRPPTELEAHIHHVHMLLNYLDTIAIGIEQRVYDEKLARDYLERIVANHAEEWLTTETMKAIGCRMSDYNRLAKLATRWNQGVTLYGRPWWKRLVSV